MVHLDTILGQKRGSFPTETEVMFVMTKKWGGFPGGVEEKLYLLVKFLIKSDEQPCVFRGQKVKFFRGPAAPEPPTSNFGRLRRPKSRLRRLKTRTKILRKIGGAPLT